LPAWLGPDLEYLFAGRALRSLSQGYLAIIVPLFLATLGYRPVQIGIVFTAGSFGSMVLTAAVGFLADRWGRKTLLIALGILTAVSGIAFALAPNFWVLIIAAAAGTIGRGGNAGSGGAFGPYFPAEQALIAEHAGDVHRTTAFGAVSLVGVLAGAAGSLVATTPSLLHTLTGTSMIAGDRILFYLTAVLGIAMAIVILPVREAPRPPRAAGAPRLSRSTRHVLVRFLITNATNGLAIGMLGPVLVYWLHLRYGATSGQLGTLFFITNIAAAPSYLASGRLARKLGAVRAVVAARTIAVGLLALIPLMPTFVLAAAVFLLRTLVNVLSAPIRQSYLMGVVDPADRSTAAGLSNLPLQACSTVGPTLAGQLMEITWLGLPLELAAALQGVNAVLYYVFFRDIRPPEELPIGPTEREPKTAELLPDDE
jgi:MFS family permease